MTTIHRFTIFIVLFLSSFSLATSKERRFSIQVEELEAGDKCLKLRVKKGRETVQTIEYQYPRESLENAVFVEKKYGLSDVNFDGHDDLLIRAEGFIPRRLRRNKGMKPDCDTL